MRTLRLEGCLAVFVAVIVWQSLTYNVGDVVREAEEMLPLPARPRSFCCIDCTGQMARVDWQTAKALIPVAPEVGRSVKATSATARQPVEAAILQQVTGCCWRSYGHHRQGSFQLAGACRCEPDFFSCLAQGKLVGLAGAEAVLQIAG